MPGLPTFESFSKIPRADKVGCWITEKIDGTNAQIFIDTVPFTDRDDARSGILVQAGSRNRWISATDNASADNFGFARWVEENKDILFRLGVGRHFGEWYGAGIGRRYDMTERRFALFDRRLWSPEELDSRGLTEVGVQCVPILATCSIDSLGSTMPHVLAKLEAEGSVLVPGFMKPEGVVVQIGDAERGVRFKVTDNGNRPKWQNGVSNPEQYKPGVLQDAMPLFKTALPDRPLSDHAAQMMFDGD